MNSVLWFIGDVSLHGIGAPPSIVPNCGQSVTHVPRTKCYPSARIVPSNKALQQSWHACRSALAGTLEMNRVKRAKAGMQARHAAELWR
jgi:hypothetical protein